MTKETKIGLLVGLGFIILFAIILSEKGAKRGTAPPSDFSVADASAASERASTAQKPLSDVGRIEIESRLPPAVKSKVPSTEQPVAAASNSQSVPSAGVSPAPLPAVVVERLNKPVVRAEEKAPTAAVDAPEKGGVTLKEAVAAALEAEAPVPGETRASELEKAKVARAVSAKPEPIQPKAPVAVLCVHRVEPGESLGKIAARYYGRATPSRIRAIFSANRDVLKRVEMVRAGADLRIPEIEALVTEFEPAPGFVATNPPPARSDRSRRGTDAVRIPIPVGPGSSAAGGPRVAGRSKGREPAAKPGGSSDPVYEWYVVQARDTLSGVAKRELGKESLYTELYRLNRDIIRDKDRIKPGMKIRLRVESAEAPDRPEVVAAASGADMGD